MTYKIKRLAKISAVVAGIFVVSVSLGMISALELRSYAISHHKDPATAGTFSVVLTLILLVGGIGGFLTASGELKAKPDAAYPEVNRSEIT
jgi:putative exporter of polyketide antibiotics